MTYQSTWKTRLLTTIGTTLIGCIALSSPVEAMPADISSCQPALTDVRVTNTNLLAIINDLSAIQNDIGKVEHYLEIPLKLRDDLKELNATMTEIDKLLKYLADLADAVPEIAEPLNNMSTAMNNVQKDVLAPISKVVADTVNVLHIQDMKKELDTAKKHIGEVKKPVSETQGEVSQVITDTNTLVAVVSAFPQGSCRKPIAQDVNVYCTGLDDVARPIANSENDMTQTVTKIERTIQNDVLVIFRPFDAIERDLDSVTRSINSIHHDLLVIESNLKHRIHLVVAGITVVSFSVKEILDDWNHAVNVVKHFIGLDKAEKWLRKEVEAVMRPPIHSLENSIRHMIKNTKIDGMNMNDAKKLLNGITNDVQTMKNEFADAKTKLQLEEAKAKALAGKVCK